MVQKKTGQKGLPRHELDRPPRPLHGDEGPELLFGSHSAVAALANPRRRIRRVLVTRNAAERHAAALSLAPALVPEIVEPRALDRLTGPDAVHQGIVVEADPLPQPRLDHGEGTVVEVMDGDVSGFVFTNNIARHNTYGIKGQGTATGNATRLETISGALDTGLNAMPGIGAAKNVIEIARGRDFFPDRPRPAAVRR